MAEIVGKNCRVTVRHSGGDCWELSGCVVNLRMHREPLDVTSYGGEAPWQIQTLDTIELTVRGTRQIDRPPQTVEATMANAVLGGDVGAAQMLADLLLVDLPRREAKSPLLPTHEELTRRLLNAELELVKSRQRLAELERAASRGAAYEWHDVVPNEDGDFEEV